MVIHKCGQCNETFKTDVGYFNHKCSVSGYTPKESENFNVVYQSEPPTEAEKQKTVKISEEDILKAVSEVRQNKRG